MAALIAGWIQLLVVEEDPKTPKIPLNAYIWTIAILVGVFGVIQQFFLIGNHIQILVKNTYWQHDNDHSCAHYLGTAFEKWTNSTFFNY